MQFELYLLISMKNFHSDCVKILAKPFHVNSGQKKTTFKVPGGHMLKKDDDDDNDSDEEDVTPSNGKCKGKNLYSLPLFWSIILKRRFLVTFDIDL